MSDIDPQLLERVSMQMDRGQDALRAGDGEAALTAFRTMLADIPHSAEAYYWLYSAALCAGDHPAAQTALDTALLLHTVDLMTELNVDTQRFNTDAGYNLELFDSCYTGHYVALASVFGQRAIALGIREPLVQVRHALSLQHQGRAEAACAAFQAAFQACPVAGVGQYYLYSLFHVPNGVQRYASEARAWANRFANVTVHNRPRPVPINGRRLKIGYVAPNFTRSQLYQFILPVLENHDPAKVEVTLYTADASAEAALPCARMVSVGHLNDDDATALIRKDAQDILIDTWGHTSGSRIGIFARRAAPVQVAWINFVQTTGVPQMDYVLHSDSMKAPGTENLFTETVWYMGDVTIPYRPTMTRLPDVPPPALTNGYVTLACFNHPSKISDQSILAWARILAACPNAVLLLKYRYFTDPLLQRLFQARFAAYGISTDRIWFEGHSQGDDYAQSFQRVDLMLDPSPCPGGTTSCDAIANGVPVLTLAGDDFFARIGIQVIAVSGLTELVADNWDEYVATAVSLAQDPEALAALRARVRPGFEASALRDEAGFVRKLEAAFSQMAETALSHGAETATIS